MWRRPTSSYSGPAFPSTTTTTFAPCFAGYAILDPSGGATSPGPSIPGSSGCEERSFATRRAFPSSAVARAVSATRTAAGSVRQGREGEPARGDGPYAPDQGRERGAEREAVDGLLDHGGDEASVDEPGGDLGAVVEEARNPDLAGDRVPGDDDRGEEDAHREADDGRGLRPPGKRRLGSQAKAEGAEVASREGNEGEDGQRHRRAAGEEP